MPAHPIASHWPFITHSASFLTADPERFLSSPLFGQSQSGIGSAGQRHCSRAANRRDAVATGFTTPRLL